MGTTEEKITYTVDEFARVCGIGRSLAFRMIREGEIPSIRLGRRIIVPKAALRRMLERATKRDLGEELKKDDDSPASF